MHSNLIFPTVQIQFCVDISSKRGQIQNISKEKSRVEISRRYVYMSCQVSVFSEPNSGKFESASPNETQEQFARNSGLGRVLLGVVKFVAIIQNARSFN